MKAPHEDNSESLSPSPAERIDAVCGRYERCWQKGETPRLEDYLKGVPESDLEPLLHELLRLEAHHRVLRGERLAAPGATGDTSASHRPADNDVLAQPSAATPTERLKRGWPQVPGYRIEAELGKGGMGVVYKARHTTLDRTVALKMIRRAADADEAELSRFRTEARAVARLQHPHVVQIFEVGEHEGLPFFALEFCPGGSLAGRLKDSPLPPREAARLVEQVARGMQAAHQAGIIHRDLKPANVLLAADGAPRVADFGLAKRLDEEGQTVTGVVMGTPSYMAPEQASGQSAHVGPAADVYALGAILYECLTGRPPFKAASNWETIKQVLAANPVPPRQWNGTLPRDLETVCLKCLEKEPRQRYADCQTLADELRRFLEGRPVSVRPPGPAERLVKWTRRSPAVAGLVGVGGLLVLLLVGFAVGLFYHVQVQQQRQRAESALTEAQMQKARAQSALTEAEKAKGEAEAARLDAETQRGEATRQRERAERLEYVSHIQAAYHAYLSGDVPQAVTHLNQCRRDLMGWEYRYVQRLCLGSKLTLQGHLGRVTSVAFSPDGKRLASASWYQEGNTIKGEVKVWDADKGTEVLTLKGHTNSVNSVVFSPDGKRLAAASGGSFQPAEVKVWDADTGTELLTLKGLTSAVWSVAFSPDGKRLASASGGSFQPAEVKVWDADTGTELLTLKGHTGIVRSVAFSPDGKRIASASQDKTVKVWDTDTGTEVLTLKGHTDIVISVAFRPDGKRLASASHDQTVKVWDADKGTELLTLKGHTRWVTSVAFRPDGKRLASASHDQTVKVWDADKGTEVLTLKGHTQPVSSVAFSPDGKRIASASVELGKPGEVKVWDADTGSEVPPLKGHTDQVSSVAFSPDGKRIASASQDKTVKVWDADKGTEILSLKGHTSAVWSVAFSPDGKRIASASGGFDAQGRLLPGEVKVWDADKGTEVLSLKGHTRWVTSVAFRPDGKQIASASSYQEGSTIKGGVKVWDADKGSELLTLKGHTQPVTSVAFSPDGKRLASASQDKTVKVWDADTGNEVLTLKGHTNEVSSVAFSPDGKQIASASSDQTVKVWDADTGAEVLTLKGHTRWVTSVAFSPDGKRLASASGDQTVKVWDADKGNEVLSLKGHTQPVSSVAFSPDGKRLASASLDKTVKVWNADKGS